MWAIRIYYGNADIYDLFCANQQELQYKIKDIRKSFKALPYVFVWRCFISFY